MALLQISEPGQGENQEPAIDIIVGIDLGTTNSLVGVVRDDKVEILADENGCDVIPSVVEYDEKGNVISVGKNLRGHERVDGVGNPVQRVVEHPSTKIYSVKRLMGKGRDVVVEAGNKQIRPEEVSAEILKYLKSIAQEKLKTEIKKAVIAVPAYFDEAAKNATKLAAELVGLEVMRLVNEPTAAALAYGLENSSEGIYAVYDLGGGTFDVSILKMQKGVFKVIGVAGDNHLGGDDFDELLAHKLGVEKMEARRIKEELSSVRIYVGHERVDGVRDPVQQQVEALNFVAEDVKAPKVITDCWTGSLTPSTRSCPKSLHQEDESNFSITRNEFEELITDQINKTISLTTNLFDDLELEPRQIKGVILVGGSTRIPLIRKKLAEIFGEEKILTNLDPDRVVAIGAAWQAYNLSGATKGANLLLDVIPLSLGIEMMGGIVDKVILRNSTIPTSITKEFTTYADNQTGLKLHITQGERELAKDCRSLANFEIKNIPAMKAGLARVAVTFKVDADGLLTVTAEEKLTREKQEIIIKPTYGLDANEVKQMLLSSMQNSKSDMEKRLLAKTIVDANKDIMILEEDLKNLPQIVSAEEKNEIIKNISSLKNLIENSSKQDESKAREAITNALEKLEKSAQNLVLNKVNSVLNAQIAGKKIDDV